MLGVWEEVLLTSVSRAIFWVLIIFSVAFALWWLCKRVLDYLLEDVDKLAGLVRKKKGEQE